MLITERYTSNYYYSKVINFVETGKRNFPCTGGYRYMHIDSEGNVKPCAFTSNDFLFGNIKQIPLEKIWMSNGSNSIRKKLHEYSFCKKCSSDCDLFSLVRDEFFDFFLFLMSNPKLLGRILKRYLSKNSN